MARTNDLRVLAVMAAVALVTGLLVLISAGTSAKAASPEKNSKIAFVSTRDGNEEIYVMDSDGTNETRLTDEPGRDIHPMFSPDGQRLTFTRRPLVGGVTEETIHVMDPMDVDPADGNGDNPIRLTPAPSPNFMSAYSPDGSRMVFLRQEPPGSDNEIWVMDADGTNPKQLTDNTLVESRPVFSPDGEKIVYGRRAGNTAPPADRQIDVYVMDVMDADGTEPTRLTTSPANDNNPRFSPDGEKIAFESTRDGSSDIYVMNPDGTGQTPLISEPDSNEQFPAFSPDGEQLAFSSDHDGNEEIYVTDLDGSADPVPLTETESPEPPEPPVVNTRVDWGPFLYDCVGRPLATLKTQLSGDKEEPGPGDPDGTGRAVIKVFRAQVFFALTVENIEPATAAHIHLGLRDEAGPVVAPLVPPPTGGSSSACVDIPRALSLELREHPFRYYVNVHNEEFPNGAVRGQLHR